MPHIDRHGGLLRPIGMGRGTGGGGGVKREREYMLRAVDAPYRSTLDWSVCGCAGMWLLLSRVWLCEDL